MKEDDFTENVVEETVEPTTEEQLADDEINADEEGVIRGVEAAEDGADWDDSEDKTYNIDDDEAIED